MGNVHHNRAVDVERNIACSRLGFIRVGSHYPSALRDFGSAQSVPLRLCG